MTTATIGSISHGTLRTADLLSSLAGELAYLSGIAEHVTLAAEAETRAAAIEDGREETEEDVRCLVELFDELNEMAPAYCTFGAHEGDASDFGFWPVWEAIDELPKFNDLADVPADIDEDYAIVNDHGNVTVYNAEGVEVFACV